MQSTWDGAFYWRNLDRVIDKTRGDSMNGTMVYYSEIHHWAQVISTGDFDVCCFSPIAGVCLYIHSFRGAKSLCERERWKERPGSVLDI